MNLQDHFRPLWLTLGVLTGAVPVFAQAGAPPVVNQNVDAGEGAGDEENSEAGTSSTPESLLPPTTTQSLMERLHGRARWDLWDDKLRFRVGGTLQVDGTAIREDDQFLQSFGATDNSIDIRRARINTQGTLYGLLFSVQYDFGEDNGLKDAYMELLGHQLKFAELRVGNFKEPFGLERQTSNAYAAFLERSLPVTAFAPGRSLGLQLYSPAVDRRATWAIGAFTSAPGPKVEDVTGSSKITLTGRLTGLPIYSDGGDRLLHLGLSVSARSPEDDTLQYSTRPEARSVPYIVDTGSISTKSNTLIGLELAGTYERSWFMAEYMQSRVDASDVGDPTFDGYHVQVGHFLTSDKKPYDTVRGVFGHPLPDDPYTGGTLQALDSLRPFRHARPLGAWEVVARLSHVDLDDAGIQGGMATNVSGAINWYISAYARIEFEYVHTKVKDNGSADILLTRLQFTF